MWHNFKNIGVVSLFTVGSRVLGLVRDILIFASLGAGIWNSAFILAFTLPNLFRRLLGEGALTSALVPVFTGVLRKEGRAPAFQFFNQIVLRLLGILLLAVGTGIGLLWLLEAGGWLSGRWRLGAELSSVLLPYMIFICLAAILSAGLQCLDRFAVAASTPLLLNLAMIAALVAAHFLDTAERGTVYWLCGGVLLGGFLQMALPGADFMRQGWRPRFPRQSSEALGRLWRLFLPGLLGAAILQVNILVSRLLAYSLDASSVSVLYLASRLMELPLGIFTIAVVTVYFPLLSRMASEQNREGFRRSFGEGIQLIVAITIPAGIGLAVLAQPILGLLFEWGAFEARDVAATLPLLMIYGFGLPLYSIATFATRGLHAGEDMVTPVRIAAICLLSNAAMGLIFMQFIGAAGLALGNVLSALLQAALLWMAIGRSELGLSGLRLSRSISKVCLAGFIMGIFCWVGTILMGAATEPGKLRDALTLLILIPGGAAVFFSILGLLKYEAMENLKQIALARFRRGR